MDFIFKPEPQLEFHRIYFFQLNKVLKEFENRVICMPRILPRVDVVPYILHGTLLQNHLPF